MDYDFTYTGAEIQAILDTAKKLKDSGYIFLGVATPSTNPGTPTQKVYYEAKQAGTYTNFGGVVLPDGISLLKWNGSWTSETVMCGDGGVFDISVYKSSGGTLATFADLSAALDGGNNIPASARKGGMSVKYVQSSDNKYVQYRLMSQNFSTTVSNWQGVDKELKQGSQNLVESGGAFKKLSAKTLLNGYIFDLFTQNYWINTSAQLQISANFIISDFIKVCSGDKFSYNLYNAAGGYVILFCSSEDVNSADTLKSVKHDSGSPKYVTGIYTATADGYLLVCAAKKDFNEDTGESYFYYHDNKYNYLDNRITDNETSISAIDSLITEYLSKNNYLVCDTAAGTQVKTIVNANFKLVAGIPFIVKFVNGHSSSNSNLKINGVEAYFYYRNHRANYFGWNAGEEVLVYYTGNAYYGIPLVSDAEPYTKFLDLYDNKLAGIFINNSGACQPSANYAITNFIKVNIGDSFKYHLRTATNGYVILFCNTKDYTDNDLTLSVQLTSGTYADGTYTATKDGYIVVCFRTQNDDRSSWIYYNSKAIKDINQRIDDIEQEIPSIVDDIVTRNKDVEDIVFSAAKYNTGSNNTVKKNFCLLVGGDPHGEKTMVENMVQYLNNISCIDAAVVLGDIVRLDFTNDATFYTDAISEAEKPFLTVIGNHDVGLVNYPENSYENVSELYAKFIAPNIQYAQLQSGEHISGNTYYYKDFNTYSIRMIVLNQYEYPSDKDGDAYVYPRGGSSLYSQQQINWLIATLQNTPADYGVIICCHSSVSGGGNWSRITSPFTSKMKQTDISQGSFVQGRIIEDIVNAFILGTSISQTYTLSTTTATFQSLTAIGDFTSRGVGKFICYLGGHFHRSIITESSQYTGQKRYNCDTMGLNDYTSYLADLPRQAGTKSEDSLVIFVYNPTLDAINLVKIGAHVTQYMEDRLMTQLLLT